VADSIGFSPGVDLPKPSAGGPQVPAGLGTFGISCRLLPVAPASSGLSLSRSRWMLAKWLGAEPVSMRVAGVRAEAGCCANSARENGAPERIRTSDPQIRSEGFSLFSLDFFVNFAPHHPLHINDLPVGSKPERPA